MAATIKIWRCPICGDGRKAPKGMRLTDIRRFCLKCSQETGHLVARKTGLRPPVDRSKYIVASNGLQPALTDEEHHQQHVVDEMPVLCNPCFVAHRGGMAKPCGILDCECYCNRSRAAPPTTSELVARHGLPADIMPAELTPDTPEAYLADLLAMLYAEGTEVAVHRTRRPVLVKEIAKHAAQILAARAMVKP